MTTYELLDKLGQRPDWIEVMGETTFYDGTDVDVWGLKDDIAAELEIGDYAC